MGFPPPQGGKPQPDGQVDSYERVVNGKVIRVNAYAKKSSTTTEAAKKARLIPGRPRIAAQPGSYSSGRDIPGAKALPLPPQPPPPPPPEKGQKDVKQQPDSR